MIKLTDLARLIKNDGILIWHKNKEYSLLSDGVFVVKIDNDESKYPKSLINKLKAKFGNRRPKNSEWLMVSGKDSKIVEQNISEIIKELESDKEIHEITDTKLIDHRKKDLYARVLETEIELVFIDNNKFEMVNHERCCKIFGSTKFKPVFFSETGSISDWKVMIMPIKITKKNEWIKSNKTKDK